MAKNKDYNNGYFLPFFNPTPMDFNMLFRHYFDFILRDIFQMFKFEHLPDTINETFFKYCIFYNGKATIFRLDSGEIVALNGVYSDNPDLYYIPEKMLVENPTFNKTYLLERNKECVVVYCSETDIYNQMERYGGLYPLICRTATMLADSDLSINVAQKNKRLINVLAAEDQGTKDSIDVVIKKQYAGEPYAVVMKSLIDNVQSVPITDKSGGNQDILQLIKAHQYILAHFYEALGLQTHDNMKQERLITAEINDNDNLAKLNINDIFCTIKDGIDKVNAMFGTNIDVHLNPLLKSKQQSDAEPEEQQQPDSEPEEQQQSDAEPEEQQQSDAEPEEQQQSDAEPEEQQQPDSEPEEQQQSDAEPEEQQQSDAEPEEQQQSDAEPEEQQQPDAEPEEPTIEININLQDESSAEITIDTGGDDDADNEQIQGMGDDSGNNQ